MKRFFPFKTKPYFDVSVLSLSTHNRPSLRGPVSLSLSPQLPSVACGAVLHVRRAMNMVCYTLIFSLSTHAWLSLSLPLSIYLYLYMYECIPFKGHRVPLNRVLRFSEFDVSLGLSTYLPTFMWVFDIPTYVVAFWCALNKEIWSEIFLCSENVLLGIVFW